MATVLRAVVGLLLIAHGLVHMLYIVDDVEEFSMEDSWLVPESWRHPAGLVLMWSTVAGFALLGLAVWGVPGLGRLWPVVAIAASAISLVLMVAFWNSSLVFGVVIDATVIAVAVLRPEWTDRLDG